MTLENLINAAFYHKDMDLSSIPNVDLYMDQILTLFEENLKDNKRYDADKIMTKTMINNYSKENILTPVRGKKYSYQQIMHILCIYILKQTLTLKDIKLISTDQNINYSEAYDTYCKINEDVKSTFPAYIKEHFNVSLDSPENVLALCLALSSAADSLTRISQKIADEKSKPFPEY